MRFKQLAEWLSWLESLHPTEIDLGLSRTQQVLQRLNLSKLGRWIITVAGTNGKGSTIAMLQSILQHAGYRVGVYTSPHFLHYNERVVIDGQPVSDGQLMMAFNAVDVARQETSLTYFEFGTLAAIWLFQQQPLDVVLLEVGLGGRLDAVNIVDPDIAVVTSIGLDHESFLGNDLNTIAWEKTGIVRANIPLVYGDDTVYPAVVERMENDQVKLLRKNHEFGALELADSWSFKGKTIDGSDCEVTGLPYPSLPFSNAITVLQVLQQLPLSILRESVMQGLISAKLPGRLQIEEVVINGKPSQLILDVAHNPAAAQMIAQHLKQANQPLRAVLAVLADKDVEGIVAAMAPVISQWYLSQVDVDRALAVDALTSRLDMQGVTNSQSFQVLRTAIELAAQEAEPNEPIIVLGSFYTVAETLKLIPEWAEEQK
ncbi:bifunctional tetrahydrofolate synthase/dihydrofolate synthase [Spartinivicinus ruber]|uniref:bifunctional tetrahydrofolate synthase/dihydrofolate synthase n=1 Tax=Spartinivicinus ruber TaxID=2683272 RepID=UPI0013D0CACF|nr:bifunctional tetrahydrofolate synthase/dihydrofolate synthase [Spartinivicinus ruber]